MTYEQIVLALNNKVIIGNTIILVQSYKYTIH